MARILEEEIERLKRDISLERLAEAKGVKLRKHGENLIGLCPFHDDREPSLVITPEKNLWHCLGACQAGGTVIDWVMKAEGVSFRHAVELLREGVPSLAAAPRPRSKPRTGHVVRHSTVSKLAEGFERNAEDEQLMARVVSYYHESLKQSPEALEYLASRGLRDPEMVEHFRLGFSNRTLGYRLPQRNRAAGAELRGQLERLGILRESGHEHFNGSLVIPIFDEQGQVSEMYGRKITVGLRPGTPLHLYLPGPHRGIWNIAALQATKEIILCESLIDALTFWCAGFRNVTASYGVEGFTDDHRAALVKYGTERVYIAYDRDEAGDRAAEKLGAELIAMGIECLRVLFPKNMDANEYALKLTPASQSLGLALGRAEWIGGKRKSPAAFDHEPGVFEEGAAKKEKVVEGIESVMASRAEMAASANSEQAKMDESGETSIVESTPSTAGTLIEAGVTMIVNEGAGVLSDTRTAEAAMDQGAGAATTTYQVVSDARVPDAAMGREELVLHFGDRRWRVRGLPKSGRVATLRLNLFCSREGAGFHVDTLELYSARQRAAYTKQASEELGVEERVIKKDLGEVLLSVEDALDQQARLAEEEKARGPKLSDAETAAALGLLRDPNLLDRILEDFERCGVVGERTNKLMGYLAATSRKLDEPLAVVIQSSSAAGKSSLMEAILAFMPEEERVEYSAMTGQSLFYMGETNLQHKILAIVEEEGAERAAYALKLLQSEGELTIASTGKDPATGRLITQEYRVQGPVMIFLTTTAVDVDEELLNRCLVLTVDEGREQTRAIHERQRFSQTLEGLLARQDRQRSMKLHQDAQRLLRPLLVANPFARELTFLDHQTRTRRDHMKYLDLIRVIALLHQYQRPVKTAEHRGHTIRYVEATREDIRIANRLAHEVLGRSLDELPPQTRRLLEQLDRMVTEGAKKLGVDRGDFRFSRRQIREQTAWSYEQLRVHLGRLVDLEYLLVHRGGRGQSFVYELCYSGEGRDGSLFLSGLVDPNALEVGTSTTSTLGGAAATLGGARDGFGGPLGAHTGDKPGGSLGPGSRTTQHQNGSNGDNGMQDGDEARPGKPIAQGVVDVAVTAPARPNGKARGGALVPLRTAVGGA